MYYYKDVKKGVETERKNQKASKVNKQLQSSQGRLDNLLLKRHPKGIQGHDNLLGDYADVYLDKACKLSIKTENFNQTLVSRTKCKISYSYRCSYGQCGWSFQLVRAWEYWFHPVPRSSS